jgi:hypothetical protein
MKIDQVRREGALRQLQEMNEEISLLDLCV